MDGIAYKGRKIRSSSIHLPEENKWSVAVNIITPQGDSDIDQAFFANDMYDTKEDGDHHSLDFGKHIIDGKYPEFLVEEPS